MENLSQTQSNKKKLINEDIFNSFSLPFCTKSSNHNSFDLSKVCIENKCNKKWELICSNCMENHVGHNTINFKQFITILRDELESSMNKNKYSNFQSRSTQEALHMLKKCKQGLDYVSKQVRDVYRQVDHLQDWFKTILKNEGINFVDESLTQMLNVKNPDESYLNLKLKQFETIVKFNEKTDQISINSTAAKEHILVVTDNITKMSRGLLKDLDSTSFLFDQIYQDTMNLTNSNNSNSIFSNNVLKDICCSSYIEQQQQNTHSINTSKSQPDSVSQDSKQIRILDLSQQTITQIENLKCLQQLQIHITNDNLAQLQTNQLNIRPTQLLQQILQTQSIRSMNSLLLELDDWQNVSDDFMKDISEGVIKLPNLVCFQLSAQRWVCNSENQNQLSSKSVIYIARILQNLPLVRELSLFLADWNIKNLQGYDIQILNQAIEQLKMAKRITLGLENWINQSSIVSDVPVIELGVSLGQLESLESLELKLNGWSINPNHVTQIAAINLLEKLAQSKSLTRLQITLKNWKSLLKAIDQQKLRDSLKNKIKNSELYF